MLDSYGEIITIEDLCEILMIGKNTAYKLLNQEVITAFRLGNRWKIPKVSIINYLTKVV